MILNCAIIDEDPEALALLKHYVEETPSLNLIGAYHNAIEAVDGIHHSHLDILFLAIHMQQISGLEFAKLVPMNVKIIFTTAFKEYAIEAYKVNAFDYLVQAYPIRRLHADLSEGIRPLYAGRRLQPYKARWLCSGEERKQIHSNSFREHTLYRERERLREVPHGGRTQHHDPGQPETPGRETSAPEIQKSAPLFHCQSN